MREAESFRIGLLQNRAMADPEENLERTVNGIRKAAAFGAQIICTHELFRTRYFCQKEDVRIFDLAEPVPGPSTRQLARVARECQVVVVASLFEKRAAGLYHNSAAVIDADGQLLGLYRKMHIPDDPLYYEKFYFAPGDLGFRVFTTRFARLGLLICWDQWYPEAARLTALAGAEVILCPTSIGWHPEEMEQLGAGQHDAWVTAQRAHALANGLYLAAVNRVGHEGGSPGGIRFWGGSFVADPLGRVVGEASQEKEEILVTEVRRDLIEDVRRHWPFLRDRRIDAYQGLNRRFID